MDPISAVGLLASISSLADGAFNVVSFINTIREGGKQRLRLFTELNSLWMILKLLEGHFDAEDEDLGEPWLRTIAVLDEDDGIFDQIQATFDNLMSRLQPKTGHRKVVQTLRWPFDKSEVEALTVHLERLKSSVNLSLNSTNAAVTREMQSDTKFIKHSVANDEVKAMLDWISSLNFLKQQDDFIKQARQGTGEWFLEREDFKTWTSKTESLLWCHGIPGAGKTFLASIVIEHLKRTLKWHNTAVLVIYCGYNDAKSQSIDNLIAALIKQILQIRPNVSKEIKELYNTHSRTDVFPSLETLTNILHTEIAKFDNCFIIVDALDEILDEPKRLLLLETLAHGKVNVMVTSRPIDSIRDLFSLITDISCDGCEEENLRLIYHCKQCMGRGFDLCEACRGQELTCPEDGHYIVKRFGAYQIEIEATEGDVRNYVQWRVDHEPKLLDSVNKKRALREEIAGTIVQQANGMFLLAKLHMDSLATKRTPRAVQQALQNLPTEIGSTYDQAMERIEATNEDDRKIVMNFLLWIAFSTRPLSVAEVEHATSTTADSSSIDPDEIVNASDLTSMCAGLVIIDASDIVRLVHFSAQNYFRENREKWFSNGDLILARNCLTYVTFKAFENGPCSGPTESEDFKERTSQYPLLEYCCCCWGIHASRALQLDELTDPALDFLNSKPHLDSVVQALWYSDSPYVADWDVKSGVHPLHLAAFCGLNPVVLKLLRAGGRVDCRDSLGTTPLMYAASGGHVSVVQSLLKNGANPNLVCERSSSSLHRAIAVNDVNIARTLLDHPNIDLSIVDTSRNDATPLMLAASLRRSQILPMILHKPGLDVNFASGAYKSTALTLAASSGDAQTVRQILSHPDVDVNKRNLTCTALTEAARSGFYSVVEALLDHGADPELQEGVDNASGTPLNRAIDYGYVPVVRLLLQRGASPNVLDVYNRTIVHSAAVNGQDDILNILFEKPTGVDINAQGTNGRTALHDAAYFNYCSTIQVLFENGARTDIHDNASQSPLGVAKSMNNLDALSILTKLRKQETERDRSEGRHLKHNPTSINNNDGSSLLTAAKLGMTETVRSIILLAQTDPSVDLNTVDLDRHSALHYGVQNDHMEILHHLVAADGINLNIKDRLQRTPLHWTALHHNYSAAECLLDAGADVDPKDDLYETPLDISILNSNPGLAVLLLEHGAWPPQERLQVALCAAAQWGSKDLVKKLVAGGADPRKKDTSGQTPFHLAKYTKNEETAKMILMLCEEREKGRAGDREHGGLKIAVR